MNAVVEKTVFQAVEEMDNNKKEQIVETCLSNASVIYRSIYELFELKDWFDSYVCSDEFNRLPVDTKKKVVKNFRELHEFLEVLDSQIN